MIDSALLKEKIQKSGLKLYVLAEKIGISPYGLSKKINNDSEFKVSEMEKICNLLNLSPSDRDKIFFE